MSIYGGRTTTIGFHGLPAKPEGFEALHFMINLPLSLQIAGSFAGNFCDIQTIPPSQIAQQNDGDIKLVVTVIDGANDDLPVDISAATGLTILLKKPDLTVVSLVATLTTNGRDGKMGYNLSPSHLSQAGYYYVQGNFSIAGVAKSTEVGQFKVNENIVVPED